MQYEEFTYMEVIPDLIHDGTAIIGGVLTSGRLVVPSTSAPDIRHGAVALSQGTLHVAEGISRAVAGCDTGLSEPAPSWQTAVVEDGGLEEIHDVLVLDILRPVAG